MVSYFLSIIILHIHISTSVNLAEGTMPIATESPRSHSLRRTTIVATDDYWLTLAGEVPPSKAASNGAVDGPRPDNEGGDEHSESEDVTPSPSIPPAHKQLLSDEAASFEFLKGHDHAIDAISFLTLDGYAASDSEDDEPSFWRKEKLSDVKQRGGGSWLLGFARLSERPASGLVPPSEEGDVGSDDVVPGLVRSSEDDSSLESEETASLGCDSEDDDGSEAAPLPARRRGVTFCETVSVQPVPHSSALSPAQRRRMYSSTAEVRRKKIRSKREWRYDGCDWRNVTEEWEMGVDMVTGELVHPAHDVYAEA